MHELRQLQPGDLLVGVAEQALNRRIRVEDVALQVQQQLHDLIVTGPKVTGVFADNANTLADDISQTAALADILRDRRHDLVSLSKNGAAFANVANDWRLAREERDHRPRLGSR